MMFWDPEIYTHTWNFATHAHNNNGQTVPGTDLPYINHIGNVAMEVMTAIAKSESFHNPNLAIQCALLHDVLEDTGETYELVHAKFGVEVADGVKALTKNKQLRTRKEQMADSLQRIRLQPHEVWMVKMADRISNLQPPPKGWSDEKTGKYRDEANLIVGSLRDASEYLSNRLKKKITFYDSYC
jgi:guanosine-3',5'-bis(diphosphate) 3'-pyrophosphohydrolase